MSQSKQNLRNNWATKLEDVERTRNCRKKQFGRKRSAIFIWHVLPGASTLDINNPQSFADRIIVMSMMNDMTKKGITEILLHTMQDNGASEEPRQKIRGGMEMPTNLKEHEI